MKKCMICMVLICLILVGCQTGFRQEKDASGAQMDAAPVPTTVVAMSPAVTTTGISHSNPPAVTTIPTIWPIGGGTTTGIPPCGVYNEHVYKNGYCIYCGNRDRSWKACTGAHTYRDGLCIDCGMTEPGFEFCTAGHTYKLGYCIYCAAQDPDFPPCKDGHTFENGFCTLCPAVDSTYDFCAQGHTYRYGFCIYCGSTDPNYNPCANGHSFNNGYCIYCLAMDPNYNPCAGGHVYQNGYCIYCLHQQPSAGQPTTVKPTTRPTTKPVIYTDYKCMYGGHVYQNGNCIYCGRKQSAGDVGATQSTTSRPAYLCAMGDHEIKGGYCIHCGSVEPKDVDAKLVVNGKDITAGNYVKINEGYSNASIPLTAVLTELGIDWKWETDKILRIGSGEYVRRLDLTDPTFGWLIPPGTLGSVREVMDGEVIIDEQALNIYFFRAQNISISTDYETNTIRITG